MGSATALRMGLVQLANENNEPQALERIEERLRRIERDIKASSEDQIFFALVFSLAVLLVTLPFGDLKQFFQDFSKLTPENSASIAQAIKSGSVVCLVASSAVRYYGIIVGRVRPSKTARALSLEFLMLAWNAFLFSFVVSAVFNLQIIFGLMTIFVAAIAALIVFIGMTWVERKVLSFYASRYFILKRDVTPFASNAFQWLALSLYLAFVAIVILGSLGIISSTNFAAYFVAVWLLLFILFTVLARPRKGRRAVNAWRFRANISP